jgi:hypothetical protein
MKKEKLNKFGEKVNPTLYYHVLTGVKMIILGSIIIASFLSGKFIERHKNDEVLVIGRNVTKVKLIPRLYTSTITGNQ